MIEKKCLMLSALLAGVVLLSACETTQTRTSQSQRTQPEKEPVAVKKRRVIKKITRNHPNSKVTEVNPKMVGRTFRLNYTLSHAPARVKFEVSYDGGRSWRSPTGVSGDLGQVNTAGSKILDWFVVKDHPKGIDKLVKMRVFTLAERERERERRQRERERIMGVPGKPWTDPNTGMEFVWVPGGCYQMGGNEKCVDGFWLGKYEVTQGEWRKVMGNNPSYFNKNGKCSSNSCPVEQISWNDSQQFFRKLNQTNKGTFRMPTEAEWEYACRSGGKNEKYSGGSSVDSVAWYENNSGNKTHPVGQKQSNGLGLYDMSGNVWEWVQDKYNSSGSFRVLRGGSWFNSASGSRCAYRDDLSPGLSSSRLGLRALRTK